MRNPFLLNFAKQFYGVKHAKAFVFKALLRKRVGFCVYRKPDERDLSFAIQKDFFAGEKKGSFVVSPFVLSNRGTRVEMNIVDIDTITLKDINLLPEYVAKADPLLPEAATKADYLKQLDAIKAGIRNNAVYKVVLSRAILIFKPDDFDVFDMFFDLAEKYPSTFTYLFFHPETGLWMGATPERLIGKSGNKINATALAGTQKSHNDSEYQWGQKEIEEHAMVERHVEDVFTRHEISMREKNGPFTIASGKVAHLKTKYLFESSNDDSLQGLIEDLEPTPAVGGLPKVAALDFIEKYEGYDRGYYTGYLGEIYPDGDMDLYVNLRCMQVAGDKIAIYVGGGITADSDPESEWQETVLKSKTLLNIIQPIKEKRLIGI